MGQSFRKLVVWQKAIELAVLIYRVTARLPDAERFGLVNQLRRASVSVSSNIAEGYGRSTTGEYTLFLGHARGSNSEVESQLVIAQRLGFGTATELEQAEGLCQEIGKMLTAQIGKLKQKRQTIPTP